MLFFFSSLFLCCVQNGARLSWRNKSAFSILLWHNYVQHVVPAAAQVIRIHHPSAAFRELAFIRGTVHCVIAIVFGKNTTIMRNNLRTKGLKVWNTSLLQWLALDYHKLIFYLRWILASDFDFGGWHCQVFPDFDAFPGLLIWVPHSLI